MSRATRGPKQTKATKSQTEASQQRVERLEVLSKTKQDRNRTFEHFEVDYYLTDNTATVHPNT